MYLTQNTKYSGKINKLHLFSANKNFDGVKQRNESVEMCEYCSILARTLFSLFDERQLFFPPFVL